MRYVLLIPGWFPTKVNFLAGDFIERHARAAASHFPVKVLFVVKDNSLSPGKIELVRQRHSDNYETFTYHYSSRSFSLVERFLSAWLQAKCLSRGFGVITGEYGLPSLIHAHVLLKHAWFALRQSKKYRLPLLASEQWTGYLPEAKGEFETLSFFQKNSIAAVLHNAVHVTTVSDYLAKQLRKRFAFSDYSVIPNLVNTALFKPAEHRDNAVSSFIHVSTLSLQKNVDEMLEACRILQSGGAPFKLLIVGPEDRDFTRKVWERKLQDHVQWWREFPQEKLATMVAAADALLLYSNYETFGCVIVEANACGVPVIVSDHAVFNENVVEGVTGYRVPLHDPSALADRMLKIINGQHSFDKARITGITREKYAFEVIGKRFAEVYQRYAKP
jgi:glycosyltransferase involved in cell wall biosynthesis